MLIFLKNLLIEIKLTIKKIHEEYWIRSKRNISKRILEKKVIAKYARKSLLLHIGVGTSIFASY